MALETEFPPLPRNKPPGPRGLPILGNALQMGSKDIVERYQALQRAYGDIVGLKLGPMNGYILYHPEFVHHVLVKNQRNYIKGIGYNGFRLLVGNGLVTSDGEFWRQQRRLMQPPFTPTAVGQFADMMADVTAAMLDRWQSAARANAEVVMDDEMVRLTMSVIGRAMFGIDLSEQMRDVGAALQEAFGFIPARTMSVVPLALPLPSHRRFQHNLALINAFVAERIAEGRALEAAGHSPDTLLSILLRATDEETGRRMTETQLRDEVVTLFFAGFETTARSLTWAWYLLTRHPHVQAALQAEVARLRRTHANPDQPAAAQHAATWRPTLGDLYRLTYTRQVVDETLRLYPPTALLARQNSEPDVIGGYEIPAGSMIILVPYMVHRHPSVWPDPERFDPDRFAPQAAEARPKSAYIPFAAGPRVCLGNSFALLEMVYALAMAAARFTVTATDDQPIAHEFAGALRPTRPLRVRITPHESSEVAR